MWSSLRSLGLDYGPLFQDTTSFVQDGGAKNTRRCVTEIQVADYDSQEEHILHPTTLDSVFISSYATLPGAGAEDDSPRVPRSIQKLWISSAMATRPGHAFVCDTKMPHIDDQTYLADITVANGSMGSKPVFTMEGLVCQSLGPSAMAFQQEKEQPWNKELCADIRWAPDGLARRVASSKGNAQPAQKLTSDDMDMLMGLRRVCVCFCHDTPQALTDQDIAKFERHHVKIHG